LGAQPAAETVEDACGEVAGAAVARERVDAAEAAGVSVVGRVPAGVAVGLSGEIFEGVAGEELAGGGVVVAGPELEEPGV
jgi:hypothetical protein